MTFDNADGLKPSPILYDYLQVQEDLKLELRLNYFVQLKYNITYEFYVQATYVYHIPLKPCTTVSL